MSIKAAFDAIQETQRIQSDRLRDKVDASQQRLNNDLESQNNELRSKNSGLNDDLTEKERELERVKEERDHYKHLLSKPMHEIAETNGNFKETYEEQMKLMAEWMVSQKAFKELAFQFGLEKGLEREDVIDLAQHKKLDVLDNNNDEENLSNASDVPLLEKEHIKEYVRENVLNSLKKK